MAEQKHTEDFPSSPTNDPNQPLTNLLYMQCQLYTIVQPGQGHHGIPLHHAAYGVLPAVGQVVSHAPALDVAVCIR